MLKKMNRKTVLSLMSIGLILLVIVITTCFSAGIDPDKWFTKDYLSSVLITLSIAIFGMISATGLGDNYYKTNDTGLFVKTYNDFNTERDKINPYIDKFTDWNEHLYWKEYQLKILRYLKHDKGIKQAEAILKLDRKDVVTLTQPQCYDNVYFKSLTKEQIDSVLLVIDGKIKMAFIHESYFLNAYSKSKHKSMYEQASEQEKTRRKKFLWLVFYRLTLTILIGLIFAGLAIDEAQGATTSQVVLNLVSRLFTFFTALSWGFYIACEMVKDECVFLAYKIRTLETFYLDVVVNKTFVPKSEEEKAYEEYQRFNVQYSNADNNNDNSSSDGILIKKELVVNE